MFETIASFLILCSMFLNVVAVVFVVLGSLTAMAGRDFAGQLLGVALYATAVSAVFLIVAGLLTIISSLIGLFF